MTTSWISGVSVASGITLTTIERIDSLGAVWVRLGDGRRLVASYVRGISRDVLTVAADTQQTVVLALPENAEKPVILGILAPQAGTAPKPNEIEAKVDSPRLELAGQEEVVLKCGKASITLTKAGKVIIRGAYLSSRSSGVNRIKGGSVQIN